MKKIEKANPFSVDNVFCSDCEDLFGEIESSFIQRILPKLRAKDFEGISELMFEEVSLIRLFFFLQLWRYSICEDTFNLSERSLEKTRSFILNHAIVGLDELNHFPLSITFLQTIGGNEEYTENIVGSASVSNPYVIFMNDFIIQFFDSDKDVKF